MWKEGHLITGVPGNRASLVPWLLDPSILDAILVYQERKKRKMGENRGGGGDVTLCSKAVGDTISISLPSSFLTLPFVPSLLFSFRQRSPFHPIVPGPGSPSSIASLGSVFN